VHILRNRWIKKCRYAEELVMIAWPLWPLWMLALAAKGKVVCGKML
jgi:hypothetical protein